MAVIQTYNDSVSRFVAFPGEVRRRPQKSASLCILANWSLSLNSCAQGQRKGQEMRVAVLAIGLALAAGPALANEPAAQAKKDADKEKVVCKERVKANSRFTTRMCLTKAEWEDQANTARAAFEEVQNRPVIFIGKGN
jgi:hypothetical protein